MRKAWASEQLARRAGRERRVLVAALVAVAAIAIVYPIVGPRTQHPLTVFLLPVLVVATLGTWQATAIVAVVTTAAATAEGAAGPFTTAGLMARLLVVVVGSIIAVLLASERGRREREIDDAAERVLRLTRTVHAGRVGTWAWNSKTGAVEWDDDLHALFGIPPGSFAGTFDAWVALIHPDDRERILAELDRAIAARAQFAYDHRAVWADGSSHWLHGTGEVLTDDDGEVLGASGVALDVDERVRLLEVEHRARSRSEFIGRANEALFETLDLDEVMERVTDAAVPELADWCLVAVTLDRPPSAPRLAVAHEDDEMAATVRSLRDRIRFDPDAAYGLAAVIRSGVTTFVPTIDDAALDAAPLHPEVRGLVRQLDLRSSIVVPLNGPLGRIGAMQLVRSGARPPFTEADVELAEDLAEPVGAALNNAILFARQQAAHRALVGLQRLTGRLAEQATTLGISETVVTAGARLLGAGNGSIYVFTPKGTLERVALLGRDPADEDGASSALDGHIPELVERTLRDGSAVVLTPERGVRRDGIATAIAVPVTSADGTSGVLAFGWAAPHPIGETELELLGNIAGRAAGALDRARHHEHQQQIASTLQRSLLPANIVPPPWFTVETRYWPGESGTDVGGDFFDVFHVRDDTWALMIGDVCGMGVEAAALTAVARHTARAVASYVHTPTGVLADIHGAIERYDGENYCTLCFGFLVPSKGGAELRLALGGHPEPLWRAADGTTTPIGRPGTLLGIFPPINYDTSVHLAPGDSLVLYTDGVTDAPGDRAVDVSELIETVSATDGSPLGILTAVRSLLVARRPRGVTDDAALLVVQIRGSSG